MTTNTITVPVDFYQSSKEKTVPTVYVSQYDAYFNQICIETYYDGRNYDPESCSVVLSALDQDGEDIVVNEIINTRDGIKSYFEFNYFTSTSGEYDVYCSIKASSSRIGVKAFKLVVIPFNVEDIDP